MTDQELQERYPRGFHVRYADGSATTQAEDTVLASGRINGEAWEHDGTVYVPVWSARDAGREPTTVMVHAANIVEVLDPRS